MKTKVIDCMSNETQGERINVELLKLKDAIAVAEKGVASEEELAAAYLVIKKFGDKLSGYQYTLSDKLKSINLAKQQQMELVYSNTDSETTILTEEVTYTSVDMRGIHKDANAQIEVTYSNPIYNLLFTPVVKANRKQAIALAETGVLPNANKHVKKTTYWQTKLFDFKESDK